jgi:D-alanyl-D-alanine carboxypeptidase (penicillin-binding protein 5/6)
MMKRILAVLLSGAVCLALLCGGIGAAAPVMTPAPQATAAGPEVSAPSAVLMHESGKVLYEKDAHARLEPASVTKIMTLLLAFEALDAGTMQFTDPVVASANAASMGGSQVWLKEGETLTVDELLKCIAVVSANDCSVAMAEHLAGSEEAFAQQMNDRAAELGMADTHFVNCTGLPAEGHLTSAWDIALMSNALLSHKDVQKYTLIWQDSIRGGASVLTNTNRLVHDYPGTTGL